MQNRCFATTSWLRVLASILLWASGAGVARANTVDIIVERLDRGPTTVLPADVVAGRFDADFVAERYAALLPDTKHDVWYRLRLAGNWTSGLPAVLSIFDPQGLFVTVYQPPDYKEMNYNIYDSGAGSGFTRHALEVLFPPALTVAQPIYLRVSPAQPVPRSLEVDDVLEARRVDLQRARMDVVFPAVQLATLLVMLSFFLALRERVYAFFVGHVFFLVVYELYSFGIGYEYPPFSFFASLHDRPLWFAAIAAVALMIEFVRRFLELDRVTPKLDAMLEWARWPLIVLALCAAVPVLSPGWWVEDAMVVIMLFVAPLLIAAGVLAWLHGGRRGGFFLCAWVPGLLLVVLRALQIALHWPFPSWLEFLLPAAFAFASLVLAYGLADHTLSIRHERDVANRLAEHDALTGVLNRRAILARLRAALVQARESGEPLALLFLDLDHFKRVNDSHGHRAGDHCLRAIIGPIASELRQGDAFGRYGGEEFLVVLPGAAAPNAEIVAERIRSRVAEMPVLVSGKRIGLTLSIGIAALDDEAATPDDLIERADAALYASKSHGRNRVSRHDRPVVTAIDRRASEI